MNQADFCKRILGNLNTAVMTFDAQLRVKYINPAGEILLAASSRVILGQDIRTLLPEMEIFTGKLKQSLDSGHPYTEREVRLTLPGGHNITVDSTVTPLSDQNEPELLLELQQVDRHLRIAREENLLALTRRGTIAGKRTA